MRILQPLFIVNWLINLWIIEIFPEANISCKLWSFYQSMIKLSQKDMFGIRNCTVILRQRFMKSQTMFMMMWWKSHLRGRMLRIQVWFKDSLIFPNYWYQSRTIKWRNMKIPEGFKLRENIIWNIEVSFYLRQSSTFEKPNIIGMIG